MPTGASGGVVIQCASRQPCVFQHPGQLHRCHLHRCQPRERLCRDLTARLDAALQGKRPVHFIHFARNRSAHAFRDAIDARHAQHSQLQRFYVYDEHEGEGQAPHTTGLLNSEQLAAWLPASRDVDAYFLGPKPFMRHVKKQLRELGVPEAQTRYEFFGPAAALD